MSFPPVTLLLAATGADFSPIALFQQADIVVKAVMVGLALASVWTWLIILGNGWSLARTMRASDRFEAGFWAAPDLDRYHAEHGRAPVPAARLFAAGIEEWRASTAMKTVDRDGTRERLGIAMQSRLAAEIDGLSGRLNWLATIGSVAPFVGLFGTVWGIMRSFSAIAAEGSSSLAVVAPGIAEALFATAIGLFAAIPAVVAYNRFAHRLDRFEARLNRFADGLQTTFSRELEAL